MVHFVGAGPGAVDLITLRGARLLGEADTIIYAGSLVNPQLLDMKKEGCQVFNSAVMTLEEVIGVIEENEREGKMTVRLHTGDPSLYGAVREQMDFMAERGVSFSICPGVSSFCGAAASLQLEYTLPQVSQSVVITRMEGRTPVPEREQIEAWAAHRSTMVIFLSAGMLTELSEKLIKGGYREDTPAAIIYKASWPEEKKIFCQVKDLAKEAKDHQIEKTALIVVGDVVSQTGYERSKLYDPVFTTEFRRGSVRE